MKRFALLGTAAGGFGILLLLLAGQTVSSSRALVAGPLVGVAQAHDGHGGQDEWQPVGEKFEWSGALQPGATLVIETVNGSIQAETGKGTAARVEGTRFARTGKGEWRDAEIRVEESGDRVKIAVRFEDRDDEDHDNWVRVDFRVEVPPGVRFAPSTVNGSIRAEDMGGPVNASSVNGSIRVGGNGEITASAVNGAIRASVVGRSGDAPVELETVNGTIDLHLPEDANADLSLSAVNGGISTDLPITVQGAFSEKRLNGRLGKGGPKYHLSTVNGEIRVLAPGA